MQQARKQSIQKTLRVMYPVKHKRNLRMMIHTVNSLIDRIHQVKMVKRCLTIRLKIMKSGPRISKNSPKRKIYLLSGSVVKK